MATLYGKVRKLARQIFGLENKFGYKSSVAGQLYMFYCIIGKIYFTDKIQPWVKYLWCALASGEIAYAISLIFLLYKEHSDFMIMYSIGMAIGAQIVVVFGYPMLVYLYEDSMDAMIELVDEIVSTSDFDDDSEMMDSGVVFACILGPISFCFMVVYCWVCFFDMMFFFEEEKVKNYLYYPYPFLLIREHGSLSYNLVINGFSIFVFELSMVWLMAALAIILSWNTVCCNELIRMRNEFQAETSQLNLDVEARVMGKLSNEWHRNFGEVLRRGIKRFQRIVLLINYMRGCVQIVGSLTAPVAFVYCVAVLYFVTSEPLSLSLKIKFLACCIADLLTVYLFYWTGQNLDNLISEVSMAAYSTPWYWSTPAVRKNLYILLCQTQSVKNFTLYKVYGLLLNNYSRFLHATLTSTNFLRMLNKK